MTMFATIAGARVVELAVLISYYGAPVATVRTDQPAPALTNGGAVSLVVSDLTLQMAVYRSTAFAGAQPARLVGGFGGWMKPIVGVAYNFPSTNITSQFVLNDVALQVGEQVSVASPTSLGSLYFVEAGPASRTLRTLAGALWWIDPSGVTQVGPRTNTTQISTPFQVIDFDPARGSFAIATENLSDWMPGRTFSSPTVTALQTITSSEISFDHNAQLRLEVLVA
jgi:hypothetical protein